jgi:hypothetical protein
MKFSKPKWTPTTWMYYGLGLGCILVGLWFTVIFSYICYRSITIPTFGMEVFLLFIFGVYAMIYLGVGWFLLGKKLSIDMVIFLLVFAVSNGVFAKNIYHSDHSDALPLLLTGFNSILFVGVLILYILRLKSDKSSLKV